MLTIKGRLAYNCLGAGIAQMVEQRTENPRVPSSILGPGTSYFERQDSTIQTLNTFGFKQRYLSPNSVPSK